MLIKLWLVSIICFYAKTASSENELEVKGNLTVANLKISSKNNAENGLIFVNKEIEYKLGINEQNELILSKKKKPIISIDSHDNLNFLNTDISVKVLNVENSIKIKNNEQFNMLLHESFTDSSTTIGWTGTNNFNNHISVCGGINLLGGYGYLSQGTILKVFDNLPSHTKIKIKTNFHFIDDWQGETAYLQIKNSEQQQNFFYVWTDTHSQLNKQNSINICGNSIPESKFYSLIDVIFPHTSNKLIVQFGTTNQVNDPNKLSWGISNFQLYII
ncbi:conserved protein, unknown function [Hepatocystis sp. ex Piliocolobus tephrosceles]|nr:conserved protein, unknown function [Hepatocystis sp. ex Piliocolobus tephrosceles]